MRAVLEGMMLVHAAVAQVEFIQDLRPVEHVIEVRQSCLAESVPGSAEHLDALVESQSLQQELPIFSRDIVPRHIDLLENVVCCQQGAELLAARQLDFIGTAESAVLHRINMSLPNHCREKCAR